MSDYRRLISYIYEYEGKAKGKNIGFVKLEARNGQCRLNVNVKRVYVGGNAIGVYLLGRGGKKTFLGNMFVRNGIGEFRTTVDAVNVEGTGNPMDTYYGLTVHDVKNSWRSYRTIWDDLETVEAAEVADRQEKIGGEAENGDAESVILEGITSSERMEENTGAEESGNPSMEKSDEASDADLKEETGVDGNDLGMRFTAQDILPESNRDQREIDVKAIIEELDREIEGDSLETQKTEVMQPVPKTEADKSKIKEGSEQNIENKEVLEQSEESREISEQGSEPGEPREISEQSIETMMISPELENPDVLRYLQETEQKTSDPDALWQELRKMYPKIQPFDYDGGSEVLTIRPDDIGKLPRECWIYGNNSFLLHGYYNYRYLILVRLNQANGPARYLIGVPGHYYSNEKYMATMFGFPNFVLSKKQPPNDGRFGYWYTDIRMC